MARHPDWFDRLDGITETIRRSPSLDWLGRSEIHAVFGCSQRDSIRLLHKFGAEVQANALTLARPALLAQLEAIRAGSTYAAFLRRRRDVAKYLTAARAETVTRQFLVTPPAAGVPRPRLEALPGTITWRRPAGNRPGRFEVLYQDGADLMRQLALFLSAAGAQRDEFFAATEPPESKPPALPPPPLEEFAGPLDLLLEEVRRQNVAIENIALAPLVARYLDYVRTAALRHVNLDFAWLEMAATLIHWKSRALLPRDPDRPPPNDPLRDDLVRQLLAHRRDAAAELARRRAIEETRFSRAAPAESTAFAPSAAEPEPPAAVSLWDLIGQARELAGWVDQRRQDRHLSRELFDLEPDDVTVAEMAESLRTRLAGESGDVDGLSLLRRQPSASRRCCLFLAILDLACARQLEILQYDPFGAIQLRRVPLSQPVK